ncbi:hypothetical protein ACB094_09G119300 [Castanea mollissima]
MNTHKIDCREQVNQSNGVINDCSSEFGNQSFEFLGYKQPWHMETCFQPLTMEGGSQQQYIGPAKSSSTIMSHSESPASAFFATERCMGFPQYEGEVGNPSMSSHNSPACKLLPHEQNKLLGADTNYGRRHLLIPFKGNQEIQDHKGNYNSYDSPLGQLNFSSQQEKHSPRESVSITSGNSASTGAVLSSKTRIRWTQDLHEKFVECVNRLGGAEKATPKAILKLMDTDGLTIFHVKSHLQKYRIAKYMPDSTEGKSEKKNILNDLPLFDAKTGLQIREALQLQLEVQRHLHEQLEIQRNLQLKIEEQGKQLKMMFDQQQKKNSVKQSWGPCNAHYLLQNQGLCSAA